MLLAISAGLVCVYIFLAGKLLLLKLRDRRASRRKTHRGGASPEH